METYYRVILSVYSFLGVGLFRRFLLFIEKKKHKNTGRRNTNYHLSSYSGTAVEGFYGYLSYNALLHILSLFFCFLIFVLEIFVYTYMSLEYIDLIIQIIKVINVFIYLIMILNVYCIMLQRYTAVRLKLFHYKIKNRNNNGTPCVTSSPDGVELYYNVDVRVDRLQRMFKKKRVLHPEAEMIVNNKDNIGGYTNNKNDALRKNTKENAKENAKEKNFCFPKSLYYDSYFYYEDSSLVCIISYDSADHYSIKMNKKSEDRANKSGEIDSIYLRYYIYAHLQLLRNAFVDIPSSYLHGLALVEAGADRSKNEIKIYEPLCQLDSRFHKRKNITAIDIYCSELALAQVTAEKEQGSISSKGYITKTRIMLLGLFSRLPDVEYRNSHIPVYSFCYLYDDISEKMKTNTSDNEFVYGYLMRRALLKYYDNSNYNDNAEHSIDMADMLSSDSTELNNEYIDYINDYYNAVFSTAKYIENDESNIRSARNDLNAVIEDILICSYRNVYQLNKLLSEHGIITDVSIFPVWM